MAENTVPITIRAGSCHVLYAFDIGLAVDLAECPGRVASLGRTTLSGRNRRAPRYFGFDPAPLTIVQESDPPPLGPYQVSRNVSLTFYDFGALSIDYEIPFASDLAGLRALSVELAENETLARDARQRARALLHGLGDAVEHPILSDLTEDYAIFEVRDFSLGCPADELPQRAGPLLAQILRAETQTLSAQESADALACRIAYGNDDLTLVDWNAAMVFDRDAEDVRSVLEFANVELLELRFLDQQLDVSLDRSYELSAQPPDFLHLLTGTTARQMRRISRMQMEGAILFERVSNAPKLLGDQFLARLYRLAAQRFHVSEWNAGILRKLETLQDFYQQMHGAIATWRLEMLEWIVIILIALEMVIPICQWLFPVGR